MTKSELINALLRETADLPEMLHDLIDAVKRAEIETNFTPNVSQSIALEAAKDVLKELEDGNEPVYFRGSGENAIASLANNLQWEQGYKCPLCEEIFHADELKGMTKEDYFFCPLCYYEHSINGDSTLVPGQDECDTYCDLPILTA